MESARRWTQSSSPLAKVLMAISITSAAVVVHRLWYAPWTRRHRAARAEAWAEQILEQEEQMKQSGEPHSSVGNLRYED